jgi:hypothetical protein
MKLTGAALAYAMRVMREARCPLSRAEAQGLIAVAFMEGMALGVKQSKARVRRWQRRQKNLQR